MPEVVLASDMVATVLASLLLLAPEPRVVRISPPETSPNEVAIAINPTDPTNIVAVAQNFGGGATNGRYVTRDGGATWTRVPAANPKRLVQGDDAICFSADGSAHHTYIAFDGIFERNPRRAHSAIMMATSRDGGLTWEDPIPVVEHINSAQPMEGKPWPVADTANDSKFKGRLYVGWTRFDVYGSRSPEHRSHIYVARSEDSGKSFRAPVRISDKPGDCVDSDNTLEGAVPAVGPKGEVYVVWSGPEGLVFDKSLDGGVTWGKDKTIQTTPGGWDITVPGVGRANGLPVTTVDQSDGPDRGTIHVTWTDERNGDHDVFSMASKDGGETWSTPVRVNDDPVGNKKDQFFPWLAVDPTDGSVNVMFFDRRDLDGTKTAVTLARSVDGGKSFRNTRLPFDPFEFQGGAFFGDYSGVTAYGGRVVPIFPHYTAPRRLAVSVGLFRFKPGTHEPIEW